MITYSSLSHPIAFPFITLRKSATKVSFLLLLLKQPFPSNCKFVAAMHSNSSGTMAVSVPGVSPQEMVAIAQETFRRCTSSSSSGSSLPERRGKGVAIVWFRSDLRILDNEALIKAWLSSQALLPVYCVDPRLFTSSTHYFGFPKTGVLRAQFLMESLADLKNNLKSRGLDLLIKQGKPEDILPLLAKAHGAHTVFAQKETCSEELNVERLVAKNLRRVDQPLLKGLSTKPESKTGTKLQLIWGGSLYHIDDIPFDCKCLPDVYTQFRKSVESKSTVRACSKIPTTLGPPPNISDWGTVPEITELGFQKPKVEKGMRFVGGESAALSRLHEYFWKKDLLRIYKETRNGMLGPDYSTKFSPWLAAGNLSARFIYEEVKRYEAERQSNNSTYWVLFELIWRDYFRFLSIKEGNTLFNPGGPRKVEVNWNQDSILFDAWRDGHTGYPLIDANMRELSTTGFMSNRGRQIVCSFLVRDMGIDWRMGAEWFESCLLDYDPCSNYGNWTYGAGVGNDPREDRYFSIPKQAQNYDPEGEFVAYWLPELRALPKEKRNFPGHLYIKPVVGLKHGGSNKTSSKTRTAGRAKTWK
ncbi:cryptochrome DASH, chloroplastic/mitochondrial isoform X1 [Coffea eugenioides]|uniref:Cryptochrome DASH n=1 Tax=Coffea arabica TaxID=13443 RepID=A0A6P6WI80_COFAR|nr:cryptochrome DASH, chloroplastic/mitochondrial isoform X1 [Coffea eugenioides]